MGLPLTVLSLLNPLLFQFLDDKSDINSEAVMSKYVVQSWGNINDTPGEQMDLAIVKLGMVSKNILCVPNHHLHAIFQQ